MNKSSDILLALVSIFVVLYIYKTCFCGNEEFYELPNVPMPQKEVSFEPKPEEYNQIEKPTSKVKQMPPKENQQVKNTVSGVYDYENMSSPLNLSSYSDASIDIGAGCAGKEVKFISSHLLPKDDPKLDDSFSEFAPKAEDLQGLNFLDADRFTATTTTTRNANLQLRSEPQNPRKMVCPWQQSTIDPDSMRKPLEIGN